MEKDEIRKKIKTLKRLMPKDDIDVLSLEIFDKLKTLDEFINAKDIYIYLNYNQEVKTVDIIKLCQLGGKNVYLPKISGNKMFFIKYNIGDKLTKNSMGISEPFSDDYDTKCKGVFLMPLLAFDKNMNRLGYGGGYYDRYLGEHPDNIKIGLAYDFQCVDNVPVDEYDIPLDYVITEKNIYKKEMVKC